MQTEIVALRQELARTQRAQQESAALIEQQRSEIALLKQQLNDFQRQKIDYEASEKYRGIIENMELGLLEVDLEGKIIKAYPRFCEMLGYQPHELAGQSANEILLPPEYFPILQQQSKDREQGKAGVYEIQVLHKNGARVWVLISGAPIVDLQGNIVGTIGIHYDITNQKNLQHDLEIARQRAEDSQRAEQQFLANMSHEIRTPLNAIIGMSHLLNDTELSREQTEYLEVLQSSANILYSLISDLLDITKIQAGKLEIIEKEFHLPTLIKSMQRTIQGKVLNKPVEVSASVAPSLDNLLRGDDLLLNQMLLNIMGNATKFTEEGFITLQAKELSRKGSLVTVEFSISDTGIGIPEDKLDLIFQSFRQVDGDIKRKFGGTGLGLTIVKQLVEAQDGTIVVESALGRGTKFIITLTYEDTYKPYQEEKIKVSETIEKQLWIYNRVLIVEDNFMNQKYISSLLKKWNIPYDIAFNGREGFERATAQKYDLIFMDIQMPEMDGYEATIAIRNSANLNQHTPIIALTASALTSEKDVAFNAGMNDFLTKPFKPAQLYEKLQEYYSDNRKDQLTEGGDEDAPFRFNSRLDAYILESFYGDDFHYMCEMFGAFLEDTVPLVQKLRPALNANNWVELAVLAHKVKPAFGIVGLPDLQKSMQQLEQMAKYQPDKDKLNNLLREVEMELPELIEAVRSDHAKLQLVVEVS